LIYIAAIVRIYISSNPIEAPLSMGILILVVFAQSSLLERAGVTSHATLQKFAMTVNQAITENSTRSIIIGVGSHDIHEKEFQVYFDQKVIKAAGSGIEETATKLATLFATEDYVYCLIIEKDFDLHLRDSSLGAFEIIQEDYIFRRRMYLDRGFFNALLKLDQAAVNHYLKEKIILIKKT